VTTGPGPLLRVVVADDDPRVREDFTALLDLEPDIAVVGTAADGRAGIDLVQRALIGGEPVDVAMTDIGLPDIYGVEVVRRVKALAPATRVLACTMHADLAHVREALDAGADGYLLKQAAGDELAEAIRAVARGETVLSPAVARQLATQVHQQHQRERLGALLTLREREILSLLARGATSKDVARRLAMNTKTVENARARILTKLGARNMPAAIALAVAQHLLSDEIMAESDELYS